MSSWVGTPDVSLRQGDIVGLPIFPHWNFAKSHVVANSDGSLSYVQIPAFSAVQQGPSGLSLAAVLSHDCDIENPRSRSGVLIAPLVRVPASPGSAQFEEIMASGTHVDGRYSFLQLYPLRLSDSFPLKNKDVVVDFSALISLGKPEVTIPELAREKYAELADSERKALKLKFASFVGRP